MIDDITPEIMSYISEIADKMKNFRASVMVGAGFSKNAILNMPTDKKFLNWNELGDVFYEKLHGKAPGPDDKYLNVLKIAEEVESTFGRTVLNQLIKDNLPDSEYSPSDLHEKLLNLNWRDIFTTNYDTLLERTQEKITDKHYNVILNKEDLIYSKEPRIIKLHGSFPSTTPFIITEEDYRQYPKQSAVFVNTVQQALIENVLCLIGFSGDDPNFLQWIGWIRDNIGKNIASKIYLIGVFDFSDAKIRDFAMKNITVINMAKCKNVKNNYKKGLDQFINYLYELTIEKSIDKWPDEKHFHVEFEEKNINEKLDGIIKEWSTIRNSYPGWFVLDYQKRKNLMLYTDLCDLSLMHIRKGNVDKKTSVQFLYEYDWRQNKCLMPILKRDINVYEKVIFDFNPFSEIITLDDNCLKYEESEKDWKDISNYWIELSLDLLRAYRENGMLDESPKLLSLITKIQKHLTKEQKAKFNYEKVKLSLFNLNINEAFENISNWECDITLPNWEIKRSGILMELGNVDQAYKIIIDELNYMRKNRTKDINYYNISLESYLVALASYANQARRNLSARFEKNEIDKLSDSAIKRFDPYEETRLFEAFLKEPIKEKKYETECFELNRVTRTTVSSENKSYQAAFQFIRYFEEIGMPFCCNHVVASKEAAKEAISRINLYAPLWSMILQIKLNNNKIADEVWSREIIETLSNEDVNDYCTICIKAIKNNFNYIEKSDSWRESNFQLGIAEMVPEVLSRLCSRMSGEAKLQTIDILNIIYNSNNILNYKNVKNLANRLVNSMSEDFKIKNFSRLMDVCLYIPKNEREEREVCDIFDNFNYQISNIEKYQNISIEEKNITDLLNLFGKPETRNLALSRLEVLYTFNLLKKNNLQRFTEILWLQADKYGLPVIDSNYSRNYLFGLPAPSNVNMFDLIKKYILSLDITKQSNAGTISVSAYSSPLLLMELENCTYDVHSSKGVKWCDNEIEIILSKIISAWNNDKQYIFEPQDGILADELKEMIMEKYKSVDKTLSKVIFSTNNYTKNDAITTLSEELKKAGLPYLQLWIISHSNKDNIEIIDLLYDNICSSDISIINNACDTLYNIRVSKIKTIDTDNLLEKISLNIKSRRICGLESILYLMHNLIYCDCFPDDKILLNNILFGLYYLKEETKLKNNTFNCSTNECIRLRAAANSLAYILYKRYKHDTKMCTQLERWKNLSFDLKEFSEVRNKWLDFSD